MNNELTGKIIGLAINVHRELGPGLLESAYEEALAYELNAAGLHFQRQQPLPVAYKGHPLNCNYQLDLIVENQVVIELKSVERLLYIHQAQLLTYLKLSKIPLGLLINFNEAVLKQGIKRLVV
ncbi:GxxExxY protein [Endozoicomonas acroporae]|uniref:GxxExxY protein n=1 Tax=Endozoicomonas acroporae TaxID=1701104 RepID=UPI003D7975E0